MNIILKLLPGKLRKVAVNVITEINVFRVIAKKYRHWESVCQGKPVQNGKPIPWYSYPSIEFLSQFDYSNQIVFEYGSGNSSLFWADRCKKIYCIEHDTEWYQQVDKQKRNNQIIHLFTSKCDYVNSIKENPEIPDLVIVDGVHRFDCVKTVVDFVHDKTMVVVDNSDWYPETCKYLREKKYLQIDFSGFGPIVSYTTTTSIFFKPTYTFALKETRQPMLSLGAINNQCDYQ